MLADFGVTAMQPDVSTPRALQGMLIMSRRCLQCVFVSDSSNGLESYWRRI